MDTFNFTRKKFDSLSEPNQRRHIIKWLSAVYQSLTAKRATVETCRFFQDQYQQVSHWIGDGPKVFPSSNEVRPLLEFISDQIHSHRTRLGIQAKDYNLMEKIAISDLKTGPLLPKLNCHVALEGLRSFFNVGTIIRTCEAAGFRSVIIGNIPDASHPGIRKTAMGADQWIDVHASEDLLSCLSEKKEAGFRIIGVETLKGSPAFDEYQWSEKTILVFGNEEYGISSHLMSVCDGFVTIPMYGRKNSINVGNAVSVLAFHLARSLHKS